MKAVFARTFAVCTVHAIVTFCLSAVALASDNVVNGNAPIPAGAETVHTVDVVNFAFEPAELTIRVGDTVTWLRQEGFHNVVADDGSFTSGPPSATWTEFGHAFDAAGEFRYYCAPHGRPGGVGMAGKIIVVEEDGSDLTPSVWLPLVRNE